MSCGTTIFAEESQKEDWKATAPHRGIPPDGLSMRQVVPESQKEDWKSCDGAQSRADRQDRFESQKEDWKFISTVLFAILTA